MKARLVPKLTFRSVCLHFLVSGRSSGPKLYLIDEAQDRLMAVIALTIKAVSIKHNSNMEWLMWVKAAIEGAMLVQERNRR